MNAEFKAKWVEALRSGKYQQGQGQLREGDAFCCLGVACDISGAGYWGSLDRYIVSGDHPRSAYLPEPLESQFGISHSSECELIEMNDKGATFAEIADYIEANL